MSSTAGSLGSRMRLLMRAKGLTSEAVGEALGVTGSTVRQWTLGYREPKVAQLLAFARLVDASLLFLLEGASADPDAVVDWAVSFADLVLLGLDPGEALDAVTGGAGAFSAAERARLSAGAPGMRATLRRHAPLWEKLTVEQKRAVLREIERLAGERSDLPSDRSGGRGAAGR